MKPFAERLREDRRLVILRLLSEQPGYTSNSSVIHAGLRHLGVMCQRDDVISDLDMLKAEGLIKTDEVEVGNLVIITLRARGQSVVEGSLTVPGVSRPSPR